MNRNKLVIIEIFLSVLIVIGIFFLIINPYFILKGWLKNVLYINDNNRPIVEELIKKSKYYSDENYEDLKDFNMSYLFGIYIILQRWNNGKNS